MSNNFVPPVGWHKRTLIANAYAAWLADLDVDWWVTLNFNRPMTLHGVRTKFGLWLARIDREFLGHNWCRRGEERALAIAVVEHLHTNIHLHVVLRMPTPVRASRRPYQSESIQKHWRKLEPGGQCVEDSIYAKEGVARYMCKELPFSRHLEECLIISSEFHNNR
jgi:hypothetical protein